VNARVSATQVALNQPVRLEFATMPRQVDGIDIAAAVTNALVLAGGQDWKLMGTPSVNDSDTKSKVVSVAVTLMPRATGEHPIPDIPITWLQGNYIAHVDAVTVVDNIQIAGAVRALPNEVNGIASWKWGLDLNEAMKRLTPDRIQKDGERVKAKVDDGLELEFIDGRLGAAILSQPDLDLEQARTSLLERWGLPVEGAPGRVHWLLGWTSITATSGADGKGLTLRFEREDIQQQAARLRVRSQVLDVLDRGVGGK
jgi:hypothetical protein